MIAKRNNYDYLLDNLNYAFHNFKFDKDGNVFNEKKEPVEDERILSNVKFSLLYCIAYRMLREIGIRDLDLDLDKEFIDCMLTDYNIFNTFLNTCIMEYKVFKDIGTGRVSYVPNKPLADYIFADETRKQLLIDYLNIELPNIFKIVNNKEKSKKRV